MNYLLELGLSNSLVALALAALALVVSKKAQKPYLAHFLWLMVLVKLITPAVMLPVLPEVFAEKTNILPEVEVVTASSEMLIDTHITAPASPLELTLAATEQQTSLWQATKEGAALYLPLLWAAGSLLILAISFLRSLRFQRLLRQSSAPIPETLLVKAERIATKLKVKRLPQINSTTADISPMVWWIGGRVQIYLPEKLMKTLSPEQLHWVLAHELGHVRRRDYLVRWVEYLAGVAFWWNPLVFLARRYLRENEEICCDQLVLTSMQAQPYTYASSLLAAVEKLAQSVHRPPSFASQINNGGSLKRRFSMILNNKPTTSSRLAKVTMATAVLILPFGCNSAKKEIKKHEKKHHAEHGHDHHKKYDWHSKKDSEYKGWHDKKGHDWHGKKEHDEKDWKSTSHEIESAVKQGKITRQQANQKYAHLKGEMSEREKWHGIKLRIEGAVKAGKLTREQADQKYSAIKKSMYSNNHGRKKISIKDYDRAEAKILQLVAEGKAKPQDVQKRLQMMRSMMLNSSNDKRSHGRSHDRRRGDEGHGRSRDKFNWDTHKQRIEAAVKSGKMSREQADDHYKVMAKKIEYGKIEARIKQAVDSGKMSEADARKKLMEVRKEMFEKK